MWPLRRDLQPYWPNKAVKGLVSKVPIFHTRDHPTLLLRVARRSHAHHMQVLAWCHYCEALMSRTRRRTMMWCSDRGIGGVEVSGAHMQWSATNGGTLDRTASSPAVAECTETVWCTDSNAGARSARQLPMASMSAMNCALRRRRYVGQCTAGELEEHISRERKELFAWGLRGAKQRGVEILPVKVPRRGVGRCGSAMFFQSDRASGAFPNHTL